MATVPRRPSTTIASFNDVFVGEACRLKILAKNIAGGAGIELVVGADENAPSTLFQISREDVPRVIHALQEVCING